MQAPGMSSSAIDEREEERALVENKNAPAAKDTDSAGNEHHFWSEGRVILTSMYVLFVSDLLSALANSILVFILGDDVSAPGCYAHHADTRKRIGLRVAYIVAIGVTLVGSKFIFSACLKRYRKKHRDSTPSSEENESHQALLILVSMYILFVTNFVSEIAKTTLDFFVPPSKCGVRSTFGRLTYFILFFVVLTGIFALVRFLIQRKNSRKERGSQEGEKKPKGSFPSEGGTGRKRKTKKNKTPKKKRKDSERRSPGSRSNKKK